MPRQVRIEYKGAIYHVMVREDYREMIVRDNEDRKRFEKSLEEVVGEMGNDKKLRKQWGWIKMHLISSWSSISIPSP
jgi:hypothetical protein